MKKNKTKPGKAFLPFILTVIGTQDNVAADLAIDTANATIAANAATASGDTGKITTGALTTAADTWEAAATITNTKVVATSRIYLTVTAMTGTIGTNGVPHAVVSAIGTGSFTLRYGNIGTAALTGAFVISYRVVNTVA